ncbi:MAG: hypothetical protein AAF968_04740 [Pseudomonadota bacterium]
MLVVHAGPHKTGTTYIQVSYARSRGALADSGWTYPEIGAPTSISGHHDLAHTPDQFLEEDAPGYAALAALREQSNVVFSAEGFCRWEPSQFIRLADILGEQDVEIVYVIRNPLMCLQSYWGEQIKQGFSASLPERLAQNLVAPLRSRLLNPIVDLTPLLDHKRLNVRAVPYDLLLKDKVDIAAHIGEAVLGRPDLALVPQREANVSFPIALTEFLRALTVHVANGERHIKADFRHDFMAVTTAEERDEIADLIDTQCQHARRVISFPKPVPLVGRIEKILRRKLDGYWTYPVEDRPLLSEKSIRFEHYDGQSLWTTPAVNERAMEILGRIEALRLKEGQH